jgi:hypothetical protein
MEAKMIVRYYDDLVLMAGISLYADEAERSRHIGHIVSIAQGRRQSVTKVTAWYEHILAELKPRADIPDYLGALVTRKVIDLLQK